MRPVRKRQDEGGQRVVDLVKAPVQLEQQQLVFNRTSILLGGVDTTLTGLPVSRALTRGVCGVGLSLAPTIGARKSWMQLNVARMAATLYLQSVLRASFSVADIWEKVKWCLGTRCLRHRASHACRRIAQKKSTKVIQHFFLVRRASRGACQMPGVIPFFPHGCLLCRLLLCVFIDVCVSWIQVPRGAVPLGQYALGCSVEVKPSSKSRSILKLVEQEAGSTCVALSPICCYVCFDARYMSLKHVYQIHDRSNMWVSRFTFDGDS